MKTFPTRRDMVASLPENAVAAEIGVLRGEFSAQILSTAVSALHLVDCWKWRPGPYEKTLNDGGHESNYRHVLSMFAGHRKTGRVVVERGMSADVARSYPDGFFDWVYLDAAHDFDAVMEDLMAWAPKIKRGGFFLGHDYCDHEQARALGFGVVRAVTEFCLCTEWQLVATTTEEWPSFMLQRIHESIWKGGDL